MAQKSSPCPPHSKFLVLDWIVPNSYLHSLNVNRYAEKYVKVRENSSQAHKILGQCYEALRQREKALDEFRRAVELDPGGQRDTVLKICELYAECNGGESGIDRERAR